MGSHPGKDVLVEGQGQHERWPTTPSTSLGVPADYIAPRSMVEELALWQPCSLELLARTWPTANCCRSSFHTGSLSLTHMNASAISLQLLCLGGEALHMADTGRWCMGYFT